MILSSFSRIDREHIAYHGSFHEEAERLNGFAAYDQNVQRVAIKAQGAANETIVHRVMKGRINDAVEFRTLYVYQFRIWQRLPHDISMSALTFSGYLTGLVRRARDEVHTCW